MHNPYSFHLQWHITKQCNCRCIHCYQDDYGTNDDLPLKDLVKIFIRYKEFLKFYYNTYHSKEEIYAKPLIALTGGEPFIRKDFLKFLEILSTNKDFFIFNILTNATLITPSIANTLVDLGFMRIQVSIDGPEKIHDKIRGEGNYKKALKGIEYLNNAGLRVSISFTANKYNYKYYPKVVELMKEAGVNFVWSDRIIPTDIQDKSLCLSKEETKEYIKIINEENLKYKEFDTQFRAANTRALQTIDTNSKHSYICDAGVASLTLLQNGDIYPCRRMPVKVGNVMESTFKDIYLNNNFLKKLREQYNKVSIGCENCAYEPNCKGGLKCLSYAYYKTIDKADPGCWLAKN